MKIEIKFNGATVLQGDLIKLIQVAFQMRIVSGTHITVSANNQQTTIQESYILVQCDGNHAAPVCGDPECWHRE